MTDMNELIGNNEFNAAFFDDASAAWRSNKIARNQGTFNYRCQHVPSGSSAPRGVIPARSEAPIRVSGTRKKICGKKVYVRGTFIPTELLCWTHCRSSSSGGSDES